LNNISVFGYAEGSIYFDDGSNHPLLRFNDTTSAAYGEIVRDTTQTVVLQNKGRLYLHGNSVVRSVHVRNSGTLYVGDTLFCDSLAVDSGGVVTHYESGRFTPKSLAIVADYINVKSGGSVNASGKGFPAGYTVNGDTSNTDQRAGGSHGGMGGMTNAPSYDSYRMPCLPGGGGAYPGFGYNVGGGGVIRIIARQMQLDGSMSANGLNPGWVCGSGRAAASGSPPIRYAATETFRPEVLIRRAISVIIEAAGPAAAEESRSTVRRLPGMSRTIFPFGDMLKALFTLITGTIGPSFGAMTRRLWPTARECMTRRLLSRFAKKDRRFFTIIALCDRCTLGVRGRFSSAIRFFAIPWLWIAAAW
jgi:hypothetical protein